MLSSLMTTSRRWRNRNGLTARSLLRVLFARTTASALMTGCAACASAPAVTPPAIVSPCPAELESLKPVERALDRGDIDSAAQLSARSTLTCPAARSLAAALTAEASRTRELFRDPSIVRAQAEWLRAKDLSGAARVRSLWRTRQLLEKVTGATAERVEPRGKTVAPSADSVASAPLEGTDFEVSGAAVQTGPGYLVVVERGRLVRYQPEPKVLLDYGAAPPLQITPRYLKVGSGSRARFVDLVLWREVTRDDRTFPLPDGTPRTVESTPLGVALQSGSGASTSLAKGETLVYVDDVASRVITYWPMSPFGPADAHVLGLGVFDAKDGRRIAHSGSPPLDAAFTPRVSVSPDGTRLVVTTSSQTSVLTFSTSRWAVVGSYQLEMLAGGALDAAYTSDGSRLCAAWQDTFHVVPGHLPSKVDVACAFEPRTPFHTDARIGCVEREAGWVSTRAAARPVSVDGTAFARDVHKVAILQNQAGVDPLPGGLQPNPEVGIRIVVADAETCLIERRIDLGKRSLQNDERVELSSDGAIVALSGEAFDVASGAPTEWSAEGSSHDDRAAPSPGPRCRIGAILAPVEVCGDRRP